MQRIHHGLIMIADQSTGAIFPWLQKTLAKLVIFPDGKTLWEHWQEEMTEVNKAKFRKEQTKLGNDTFNWETNVFGSSNVVLKLHVMMAVPTQTNDNHYVYTIELPSQYIPASQAVDYDNACFNVTERENSTFMRKKCIHNVYTEIVSGTETNEDGDDISYTRLRVIVDHFKDVDNVNLDDEPYITGNFDIVCNLSFEDHRAPGYLI